jgi:thiamine transporter ThiT
MPIYKGDSKLLFYGLLGGTIFSALLSFALSFVKAIPLQQVIIFSFFWGSALTATVICGWKGGPVAGLLVGLFGGFFMARLWTS